MNTNFQKQRIGLWNIIVSAVCIYAAILIPLEFAFDFIHPFPFFARSLIIIIFIIDFIRNLILFKASLKKEDNNRYMNKWMKYSLLLVDFLAAFPIYLLSSYVLFGLFPLIKILRIYFVLKRLESKIILHARLFAFYYFIFWFIIVVHIISCGWFSISDTSELNTIGTNYINSLYWTVTTITTVGYGDITPVTNLQKLYAIFVQILGFGVLSYFVGSVASRLMQLDPARAKYQENLESLGALMHYRNIPPKLKDRILEFYTFMWKKRLGYDESSFLQSLPENLKTEVALHLKNDVIEKVHLFRNASPDLKREIALSLKPIFLTPGDYIFKAGDKGERMFFVVNGTLNTLTKSEDRVLTILETGDYFGEISLFKNIPRTASIQATSYCDIYALDKKSFDKVFSKYPEIGEQIRITVEEREKYYSN